MDIQNSFAARGIPVDKSYYAHQEPFITHGVVELENAGSAPLAAAISQVRCLAGDDILPIDSLFLYLLPDYDEIDASQFEIPPERTHQYEISFPRISAVPYLAEEIRIEVSLTIAGESIQVYSPIEISRRTPKRG